MCCDWYAERRRYTRTTERDDGDYTRKAYAYFGDTHDGGREYDSKRGRDDESDIESTRETTRVREFRRFLEICALS